MRAAIRLRPAPGRAPGRAGAFAALLAGALWTCGGGRFPALSDEGASGAGAAARTEGGVPTLVDPAASRGCDAGASDGVCGCLELSVLSDLPNLYFVLDRSGSMNQDDKWSTVRAVVARIVARVGPRARFGVAVFPDPQADGCSPGVEILALRPGDAPAGVYGPVADAILLSTAVAASGGTPTAATLRALAPSLRSLPGRTFVILATDGGPNCNPNFACTVDQCTINIDGLDPRCPPNGVPNCCVGTDVGLCLDADETLLAVSELRRLSIATYVIGVPGSQPYADLLDGLARAGGTARPSSPAHYQVDSTDQRAFEAALRSIAATITGSCTLKLNAVPPEPDHVNVYLDGVVVPREPTDGWRLDGDTVTLVGKTCARVLSGDALGVRVVAGCPTVLK